MAVVEARTLATQNCIQTCPRHRSILPSFEAVLSSSGTLLCRCGTIVTVHDEVLIVVDRAW